MDQLPCVNCITLSICKSQILNRIGHSITLRTTPQRMRALILSCRYYINPLAEKCSLIKKFVALGSEEFYPHYINQLRCEETILFLLPKTTIEAFKRGSTTMR